MRKESNFILNKSMIYFMKKKEKKVLDGDMLKVEVRTAGDLCFIPGASL